MQCSRILSDHIVRQIQLQQFGHIVKRIQIDVHNLTPTHVHVCEWRGGDPPKTIDIISAQIDARQIIVLSKCVHLNFPNHIERKVDILQVRHTSKRARRDVRDRIEWQINVLQLFIVLEGCPCQFADQIAPQKGGGQVWKTQQLHLVHIALCQVDATQRRRLNELTSISML